MNGTSFIPVLIAVIIIVRTRKIIEIFINSDTTNPYNAKSLEVLNISSSFIFKRLLRRGVIIEIGFEKYYLNEGNLIKYNIRRRKIIIVVFLIIIAFVLIDFSLTKNWW